MTTLVVVLGEGVIVAAGAGIVLTLAAVAYGRKHERWRRAQEAAVRDKAQKR